MGFKRSVTLACDGPCGTALPEQEKAPVGWSIELVGAVAQEKKAYALVQQAEKHLAECSAHWNQAQTRMWAIKTHVPEEVWESVYYGKEKAEA